MVTVSWVILMAPLPITGQNECDIPNLAYEVWCCQNQLNQQAMKALVDHMVMENRSRLWKTSSRSRQAVVMEAIGAETDESYGGSDCKKKII